MRKWNTMRPRDTVDTLFDFNFGTQFDFSDMKYEMDEYIVERDSDGVPSKLTTGSFNTQQHHIICVNDTDPNDYHSEQIEITEYDELGEEEEENEMSTMVTAPTRSEVSRSQSGITEPQHTTSSHSKPSTSSQCHSNGSDERFLLSCLPALQRLSHKENALARMKIQQLLFDIEFNGDNS